MEYLKKSDFYADIRRDYYDDNPETNKKNAFIYQYRKNIKDKKASSEEYFRIVNNARKDSYVLLTSCKIAVDEGKIDESVLISLVNNMLSKMDISSDDIRNILEEHEQKKKKETQEQTKERFLISLVANRNSSSSLFKNAYEYLCDRFIRDDVRDFFYNIGYNHTIASTSVPDIKKRVYKRKKDVPENDRRSRNDEALNMFFEFAEFKGLSIVEKNNVDRGGKNSFDLRMLDDNEYIEECNNFYELLNDIGYDEKRPVFVPVIIDSESGLGIYVVSKNLLYVPEDDEETDNIEAENAGKGKSKPKEKSKKTADDNQNYYFCCIRFVYHERDTIGAYRIKKGDKEKDNLEEYLQKLLVVEDEDQEILGNMYEKKRFRIPFEIEESFTDLENAVNRFKYLKDKGKDFEGYGNLHKDIEEEIEDSNIDKLLKYFVPSEDFEDVFETRKSGYAFLQDREANIIQTRTHYKW